jgi:hypothetical protein
MARPKTAFGPESGRSKATLTLPDDACGWIGAGCVGVAGALREAVLVALFGVCGAGARCATLLPPNHEGACAHDGMSVQPPNDATQTHAHAVRKKTFI